MPLVDLFDERGWHLEKGVLDLAKVTDVLDFLIARKAVLQSRFEQWVGQLIASDQDYARHQASIPLYESRGLPKDLRHYLTGEFDLETRLDARIVSLLGAARVRKFLTRLLGTERYVIHYPPMTRFKVADAPGNMLPPHQDGPYSAHLSGFITVWVPLVDIDSEVGGLIMYNGSHRHGVVEHEACGSWAFGTKEKPIHYPTTHVEMKAGDALLFSSVTIHASAPQRSATRQRYSIDFRVIRNPKDTLKSYFDPFTGLINRQH